MRVRITPKKNMEESFVLPPAETLNPLRMLTPNLDLRPLKPNPQVPWL